MKVVKMDVKKFIEDIEDTEESPLVSFYEKLGWDRKKHVIDPKKVVMNRDDALKAIDAWCRKMDSKEDKKSKMYEWFSYGPSSKDTVKQNHIKLYKGWITLGKKEMTS